MRKNKETVIREKVTSKNLWTSNHKIGKWCVSDFPNMSLSVVVSVPRSLQLLCLPACLPCSTAAISIAWRNGANRAHRGGATEREARCLFMSAPNCSKIIWLRSLWSGPNNAPWYNHNIPRPVVSYCLKIPTLSLQITHCSLLVSIKWCCQNMCITDIKSRQILPYIWMYFSAIKL